MKVSAMNLNRKDVTLSKLKLKIGTQGVPENDVPVPALTINEKVKQVITSIHSK